MRIYINFLLFFLLWPFVLSDSIAKPVRVAISSKPSRLNPLFSTDANSQNIGRLIHQSLVDFSGSMSFICRACRKFEELNGDDGTHKIVFELREDLKFWDGGTVDAESVKSAVEIYQSDEENIKSIFRFAFKKIVKIEVLEKFKIALTYDKYRLENLSNLVLLKIIKFKKPLKQKVQLDDVIGAGQYRLGEIGPLSVELLPVLEGRPVLLFKVVKDETTLALKLINQEVDLSVASFSSRKVNWLKENGKGLDFVERVSTNYKYVGINHKNKVLKNVLVRKALSMLVPRELLLKYKLKGTGELASGFMSKSFGAFYRKMSIDKYSPTQAEQLLDMAGYKVKSNGKRFKLLFKVSNNKASIELAKVLKQYFEKSRIEIDLRVYEWGTFFKGIKRGEFDLMLGQWVGFTGPDILKHVFHSSRIPPKGANRGHYVDPELDNILDMAESELDEKKRVKFYLRAVKRVKQQAPYLDLWHPKLIWIKQKCIKNLSLYPNGSFTPLEKISNECK